MALCADDIELRPPDAQSLLGRKAVSVWMARGTARITALRLTNVVFEVLVSWSMSNGAPPLGE